MGTEWTTVAKARTDLADLLDGLSTDQLATQSLCEEWSVLEVGGHVASLVELSSFQIVKGVAKKRGDADAYLAIAAKDSASSGVASVLQSLRTNASKPLKPYSEASLVVDTAVHTLDITRSLGMSDTLDPHVLLVALDSSASEFLKKRKDTSVRFEATDSDWAHGDGPSVQGTSETLLLALNSRDVSSELEGDGVRLLPRKNAG